MTDIQLPDDYPKKVDEDNHVVREYEGADDRVVQESDVWYRHKATNEVSETSVELFASSEKTHERTDVSNSSQGEFTGSREFTGSLFQYKEGHRKEYKDELGNNQQHAFTIGNYSSKENTTPGESGVQGKISLAQYTTSTKDIHGDIDTTKIEFVSFSLTDGMPSANLLNLEAIDENGSRQTEWGFSFGFNFLGKNKNPDDAGSNQQESNQQNNREKYEQESSEHTKKTIFDSLVGQVYESRNGSDTDGDGKGEYGFKITIPFINISYGRFEEKTLEERISELEKPIKLEKTEDAIAKINGC